MNTLKSKNDNIYLFPEPLINNLDLVYSILLTYSKISNGANTDTLTLEDLENIEKFYSAMTLKFAVGMLNVNGKSAAYEEINTYIGNFPYTKLMCDTFIEKYIELIEYRRASVSEEELVRNLKLA